VLVAGTKCYGGLIRRQDGRIVARSWCGPKRLSVDTAEATSLRLRSEKRPSSSNDLRGASGRRQAKQNGFDRYCRSRRCVPCCTFGTQVSGPELAPRFVASSRLLPPRIERAADTPPNFGRADGLTNPCRAPLSHGARQRSARGPTCRLAHGDTGTGRARARGESATGLAWRNATPSATYPKRPPRRLARCLRAHP
jgi:hypothetical protein